MDTKRIGEKMPNDSAPPVTRGTWVIVSLLIALAIGGTYVVHTSSPPPTVAEAP